jgi:hypothetical protein
MLQIALQIIAIVVPNHGARLKSNPSSSALQTTLPFCLLVDPTSREILSKWTDTVEG